MLGRTYALVASSIGAPRELVQIPDDRDGQLEALRQLARDHEAASPALDLEHLDDADRQLLLDLSGRRLGELEPEVRKAWHRVMASVPRFGFVLLGDVDAAKAEGGGRRPGAAEAARDVALRFVAALERRGVPAALAPSREDMSSGWHVHGWVPREQGCADLGWRLELLAIEAAREAGITVAHARSVHGIPEFPPPESLAWIDLSPLRASPSSQPQPVRLPGAARADGGGRKGALLSVPEAIRPGVLERLDPPEPAPYQHAARAPRELLPFRAGHVGPLAALLCRWRRPGTHHALRTAMCGLAIKSRLGTRDQWLSAMASAWGDPADAQKAWRSTAAAIEAGRPVVGAGRVRSLMGSWRVLELAQALSELTRTPLLEVHARLGLPTAKALLDDLIPHTPEEEQLPPRPKPEGGKRRPRRPLSLRGRLGHLCRHCGDVEHLTECDTCGVERSRTRMRCGVRELCYPCLHRRTRSILDVIQNAWPRDNVPWVIATRHNLPSAEAARKLVRKWNKQEGPSPLSFVYPTPTGWTVTAIAQGPITVAGSKARGIGASWRKASRHEALEAVAYALLARGAAVRDACERGEPERAADLLAQLYGRHEVYGRKSSPLPWPSLADVRAEARRAAEDGQGCSCPTVGLHTYTYLPSRTVLAYRLKWPRPLRDLVPWIEKGQAEGTIPRSPPRALAAAALATRP